ncbi:MAG: AmmeMemoRadiSam system protein B [Candidatus Brocadiaceae bacterium]|nr:AmmeMemoRadiSam system protein B [Candidatus Brocadiaceae bacterium]
MVRNWKDRCALVAGAAALGAVAVLAVRPHAQGAGEPREVRAAAAADGFYPGSPDRLRRTVETMLRDTPPETPENVRALEPRALLVPHAGYRYSGATAARAYRLLQGRERPDRVILLGPPHTERLEVPCSIAGFEAYETPLGRVPLDAAARRALTAHEVFGTTRRPHLREHALEVQLPFLQVLWPEPPPIVPILVGRLGPAQSRAAAAALAQIITERTLIVVSTDFTHYGARFGFAPFGTRPDEARKEQIRELDMGAVGRARALDAAGFLDYTAAEAPTVCGSDAVGVLLNLFARCEGCRPVFLQWANSGDVTGGYNDCVSYVAMAFYAPPGPLRLVPDAPPPGQEPAPLADDDRRALLHLARTAIDQAVRERRLRPPEPAAPSEALRRPGAAFVTLTRDGQLRGCIGHVEADGPLCDCVARMAVLAALRDPRFRPVAPDELDELRIEISVLTPLTRLRDVADLRVGRDGLVVERRPARGLLLPQVASEHGWDAREFLRQTCAKAGLPEDAWQDADVTIYRFQAEVFSEDQFEP